MNWMEKEDAIRREAREEGRKEGREEETPNSIRNMIRILRDLNHSEEEIFAKVDEAYPGRKDIIREIMNQ